MGDVWYEVFTNSPSLSRKWDSHQPCENVAFYVAFEIVFFLSNELASGSVHTKELPSSNEEVHVRFFKVYISEFV